MKLEFGKNLAWHVVRFDGERIYLRDGRLVPPRGEWLEHPKEERLVICCSGLHASFKLDDALSYRSGNSVAICLVHVEKIGERHADKFVCRRRRVIDWIPIPNIQTGPSTCGEPSCNDCGNDFRSLPRDAVDGFVLSQMNQDYLSLVGI